MSLPVYKSAEECRYDIISLGEIMLRLDPGDERIHTTRSFRAWEGGGEYNVARGMRRCFGLRAGVVTSFVDNPVGRLIEDFIMQGGVDTSLIRWIPFDGIGKAARNGLNFTERGFGLRGAKGCSDRGHTAVSQLKEGDIDWEYIFGKLGVRHFHTGGIFAALSETTPGVVLEALKAAKKYGTVTSYDLNYRPSLWKSIGGQKRACEVNREIASYVDVMIGNEEDFIKHAVEPITGLDLHVDELKMHLERLPAYHKAMQWLATSTASSDKVASESAKASIANASAPWSTDIVSKASAVSPNNNFLAHAEPVGVTKNPNYNGGAVKNPSFGRFPGGGMFGVTPTVPSAFGLGGASVSPVVPSLSMTEMAGLSSMTGGMGLGYQPGMFC